MFSIFAGKGFSLKFDNGYMLSVQFGPGNYCAKRNANFDEPGEVAANYESWRSGDAEVAVIRPDGSFVPLEGGNEVQGWVSVERVADLIQLVRTNPEDISKEEV